jgi:hypothetical protein
MKQLFLSKCAVALVDDSDFEAVGKYKWTLSGSGYACREYSDNGIMKRVYLHRTLLSCPDSHEVDHINGNPLDNRRCNLRLATHQENQCNQYKQKSDTSSRYKGVYFDRFNQKWRAQNTYKGTTRTLGRFSTEQEAALAYNKAAKHYFGEYAKLNDFMEENDYE